MKLCPKNTIFARVDSKFCPKQNKSSKNCQCLWKLRQSGEILPNMVTLLNWTKWGGHWTNLLLDLSNRRQKFRKYLFWAKLQVSLQHCSLIDSFYVLLSSNCGLINCLRRSIGSNSSNSLKRKQSISRFERLIINYKIEWRLFFLSLSFYLIDIHSSNDPLSIIADGGLSHETRQSSSSSYLEHKIWKI